MKVVQINTTVNTGSTGRIAEEIGKLLHQQGHSSHIAYGRGNNISISSLINIGSQIDVLKHGLKTLLSDRHGYGSIQATKQFVQKLHKLKPDIIHLHNIHGYYLNIEILFQYIRSSRTPVVWTMHDSWAYTGHCTYYDSVDCKKWITECNHCPKTRFYPKSFIDNSKNNFYNKLKLYADLEALYLITPSKWLAMEVSKSFLKDRELHIIHNGVDVSLFRPALEVPKRLQGVNNKIILGVASIWDARKGLMDFIKLDQILKNKYQIVLIGLTNKQIRNLPASIIGLERTENVTELVKYYNAACVFVNPTIQDNFPTTNLEALACGTPVVTYNTGGSPEAVDALTGRIIDKNDVNGIAAAVEELNSISKDTLEHNCRERAVKMFDKNQRFQDYITLYEKIVKANSN